MKGKVKEAEIYSPTAELAWFTSYEPLELDKDGNVLTEREIKVLKQKWRDRNGTEEWRDIPHITE